MSILLEMNVPEEFRNMQLPEGLHRRLQDLLDKQDEGETLTELERGEAEGIVAVAEFFSLLRMKAKRLSSPEV